MWFWRRVEKSRWTDGVINEGVLQKVKVERKCTYGKMVEG
jgi:hypothetical protein